MLGDSIVVSATEPTGNNRKKVWFQKGKNLFNKNDVVYGYELNGGDGSATKNELDFVSDYIKVYPGQTLYKSGAIAGISNCFYDENKKFISTVRLISGVISVPTTNSISYMRINGLLTDLDSIQITSGDTQLAYEAYIEPKIFILNNNNIYEEFTKKQEENYSEQERIIGTWTDGKPLYRKTLNVQLNDNNYGDTDVPNGYIDKVKDVIHIYGTTYYSKTSISKIPINSYIDATHYSSFYYYPASKSLRVFLGKDLAGLKAIINVEYTKTTD